MILHEDDDLIYFPKFNQPYKTYTSISYLIIKNYFAFVPIICTVVWPWIKSLLHSSIWSKDICNSSQVGWKFEGGLRRKVLCCSVPRGTQDCHNVDETDELVRMIKVSGQMFILSAMVITSVRRFSFLGFLEVCWVPVP